MFLIHWVQRSLPLASKAFEIAGKSGAGFGKTVKCPARLASLGKGTRQGFRFSRWLALFLVWDVTLALKHFRFCLNSVLLDSSSWPRIHHPLPSVSPVLEAQACIIFSGFQIFTLGSLCTHSLQWFLPDSNFKVRAWWNKLPKLKSLPNKKFLQKFEWNNLPQYSRKSILLSLRDLWGAATEIKILLFFYRCRKHCLFFFLKFLMTGLFLKCQFSLLGPVQKTLELRIVPIFS